MTEQRVTSAGNQAIISPPLQESKNEISEAGRKNLKKSVGEKEKYRTKKRLFKSSTFSLGGRNKPLLSVDSSLFLE
ncbi:hypothetical protein TNCT_8351 [Trichonephila clavata]|uniref:Uncharacterized protein n=1 Tax=Trichonephila clavata TaxID=2740835 RepID=A0A8X6J1Z8_TRICU|nr:hypothetical protein TNCT_8351 [Trichonephila clavata]